MTENEFGNSRVTAVGCSVENCHYHTKENRCAAKRIAVQDASALRKGETFCSTFTLKATD